MWLHSTCSLTISKGKEEIQAAALVYVSNEYWMHDGNNDNIRNIFGPNAQQYNGRYEE